MGSEPYQKKLARLIAIVRDCLRANETVCATDLSSMVREVLARRRLDLDRQTINRTIDRLLTERDQIASKQQSPEPTTATHRSQLEDYRDGVNWDLVLDTLTIARLMVAPDLGETQQRRRYQAFLAEVEAGRITARERATKRAKYRDQQPLHDEVFEGGRTLPRYLWEHLPGGEL